MPPSTSLAASRELITGVFNAERNGKPASRASIAEITPATIIAAIWGTGVIAMLGILAWQCLRVGHLLRRTGQANDPAFTRIVNRLSRQLGLRWPLRVVITEEPVGPAVVGLLRPTVILPQPVIHGKSADEIELILAHELLHARRGDLWFALLRSLAQSIWWFHPLVWWAARQASRQAERCCDEAVLAELKCSPAHYARCLLDVLETKHQLRSVPAFPGVRAIEVTQGRLERIMKIGQRTHRRTPWWCWAVAILVAVIALPGAGIAVSADKAPTPPQDAMPLSSPPLVPVVRRAIGSGVSPLTSDAPAYYVAYRVDDVLSQIQKEQGLNPQQSTEFLQSLLKSRVGEPLMVAARNVTPGPLPGPEPGMVAWDNKMDDLVVSNTTRDGHKRIEDVLQLMRVNGTTQVAVNIRFVTGPLNELQRAGTDWKNLPFEPPANDAERSLDGSHRNRAQVVIEKNLPVKYQVLDEDSGARLLNQWQASKMVSQIQAPNITIFNGQSGYVADASQSPFVVAVSSGQPQIRVVHEGTRMQFRPVVDKDGKLNLDFAVTLSTIRGVETSTVAAGTGMKPYTIQIPEVETARVEGGVEVPSNHWLLLGGLERKHDGKSQAMIVMLRAERTAEAFVPSSAASPQPAR